MLSLIITNSSSLLNVTSALAFLRQSFPTAPPTSAHCSLSQMHIPCLHQTSQGCKLVTQRTRKHAGCCLRRADESTRSSIICIPVLNTSHTEPLAQSSFGHKLVIRGGEAAMRKTCKHGGCCVRWASESTRSSTICIIVVTITNTQLRCMLLTRSTCFRGGEAASWRCGKLESVGDAV